MSVTLISIDDLIKAKLARLTALEKDAPEHSQTHSYRSWGGYQTTKATYQKKITFVKEKGAQRVQEMLAKLKDIGYNVEVSRVTQAGVWSLKGERGGYRLFGFVCPTGKLRLSMSGRDTEDRGERKKDIVLEINYARKNLVVHDHFLTVVVNRV